MQCHPQAKQLQHRHVSQGPETVTGLRSLTIEKEVEEGTPISMLPERARVW